MKTLGVLLKIRMASLFSSLLRRGKQKKATSPVLLVLLALLFLYAFVVFGAMFFSVFAVLATALLTSDGDMAILPAFAMLLSLALCVIGSVFATEAELYQAKDNELLLSLPIRPSYILVSRMVVLWLINVAFSAVVTVPALAAYALFSGRGIGSVLLFGFFLLLVPFLGLAVSSAIGWLVSLVSSRMKHKNVVSLVVMVAFFALYMFGVTQLETFLESIADNISAIAPTFAAVSAPFMPLGRAVAYGDVPGGVLSLLGIVAICVVVMVCLSRSYIRLITTKRGGVQYVYREKRAKQASPIRAFVRKEIDHFRSSAAYMMNEGIGLLLAPVLGVFLFVQRAPTLGMDGEIEAELALPAGSLGAYLPPIAAVLLSFLAAMVIISAPSVSLEGKNLWIAQSMPVPPADVLLSKVYAHLILATPFFTVGAVFAALATGASPLAFVGVVLLPLAMNALSALLGVVMNTLLPKFDWVNETAAVKSGAAVMLTMLLLFVAGCAITALGVTLAILGISGTGILYLLTLLVLLVCGGLYAYLRGPGARRFAAL